MAATIVFDGRLSASKAIANALNKKGILAQVIRRKGYSEVVVTEGSLDKLLNARSFVASLERENGRQFGPVKVTKGKVTQRSLDRG